MNEPSLSGRLTRVARRLRWVRGLRAIAWAWLGLTTTAVAVWGLSRASGLEAAWAFPLLSAASIGVTLLAWHRAWRRPLSLGEAAEAVERAFPELDSLARTASQLVPRAGESLPPLQQRVVDRALDHDARNDWARVVARRPWLRARLATALLLPLLLVALALHHRPSMRPVRDGSPVVRLRGGVEVTPGDVALEKGESLVVLVRFGDPVPASAQLVVQPRQGPVRRIDLKRNLQDPVFGGSVPEVEDTFTYRVEHAGRATRDFRVDVYEHPRLERMDIDLTYPSYTGLPPRRVEDTRRLSAIEGTRVEGWLHLNKPVVSARWVPRGTNVPAMVLEATTNRAVVHLLQPSLEASATYDLHLVDAEGRTNKATATFVVDVLRNRVPELALSSPKGDIRPSALEELRFDGTVWDDFGVGAFGLAYSVGGGDLRTVTLGTNVPAKVRAPFHFELSLEELGVRPDQLLAWFVWADDLGPDGRVRHTSGDMFFGEVRPFETVFREGEGGSSESGEGAGEKKGDEKDGGVKKLAELQKQILNATWKLQREHGLRRADPAGRPTPSPSAPTPAREESPKPRTTSDAGAGAGVGASRVSAAFREAWYRMGRSGMAQVRSGSAAPREALGRPGSPGGSGARTVPAGPASFAEDLKVVCDGLERAVGQARESMEGQQDPRSRELWSAVVAQMERALAEMRAARSPSDLAAGLAAQQSAYDALLKLRKRETEVTRGKKSPASAGSGEGEQASERQLEQLDLEQSEKRYETERQARAGQDPAQREQQQVMNRLAELARRQEGVNEKLKELQASLQAARTDAQREEARRALKRLEEQQREALEGLDEVQQRMEREENQSRMSGQRESMEQARRQLQQAAEATGQGQVSQALGAGTRAQRQLQEMREDLRRQNSNQLAEELRELRGESRDLARRQAELARDLERSAAEDRRSLSAPDDREALARRIQEQRARMTNLVAHATEISERVEAVEPRVSKPLYDAVRQQAIDDAANVKSVREQLAREGRLSNGGNARMKQIIEGADAKTLLAAAEFLQGGGRDIARDLQQRAARDAEALSRGVERAAEGVLGDDAESLRQARDELEALTAELRRELAPGTGGASGAARTNGVASASNPGGAGTPGTPSTREASASPDSQGGAPSGPGAGAEPGVASAGEGRRGSRPQATPRPGRPGPSGAGPSPEAGRDPQAAGGEGAEAGSGAPAGAADAADAADAAASGDPGQSGPAGSRGRAGAGTTPGGSGRPQPRRLGGEPSAGGRRTEDLATLFGGGTGGARERREEAGPITGRDFGAWSDRLRDVEELVDSPDLRSQVATARDAARQLRLESRRVGTPPDRARLEDKVLRPLVEVRTRLAEELARRGSRDALVPLDRDPVPDKYAEGVRRYYEKLGQPR